VSTLHSCSYQRPPLNQTFSLPSFNSALQIGTAIIVAILTAIHATISLRSPSLSYAPYRAEFLFMVALMSVEGVAVWWFYKEVVGEDGKPKEVTMGH
jgi:hypothetical protein